jgi:hypothetical protein
MARVPETAHGIISLALSSYCFPNASYFLFPDQPHCIVKDMCMYMYTYLTVYRLYVNYRSYQITLRVILFYANREWCEVFTGYLSFGRLGEFPVTYKFSFLSHSSKKSLLEIKYNNYTVH